MNRLRPISTPRRSRPPTETDPDSTPNNGITTEDDYAEVRRRRPRRGRSLADQDVDNATPDVGTNVVFTLTVSNAGPSDAHWVAVTDLLPNGYTYVSDDGGGAYVSGTGVWTVGALANGATDTLNITASVNAGRRLPQHLRGDGGDRERPRLDAEQRHHHRGRLRRGLHDAGSRGRPLADQDRSTTATPDVGTNVVFTLTVSNAGPSNATGVAVTDLLPTGYTYVSDDGGGAYVSGTGVWTVGALAATGASATP